MIGAVASSRRLGRSAAALHSPGPADAQNWNYEIKDGKRVPKAQPRDQAGRQLARGSPAGQLRHVKERSAAGEYKETRQCDRR